jgi:hypothetical protein
MNFLVWCSIVLAALAAGTLVLVAGILAWCWTRDQWKNLRSRFKIRRVPAVPVDGRPLSLHEHQQFRRIEQGYWKTADQRGRRL